MNPTNLVGVFSVEKVCFYYSMLHVFAIYMIIHEKWDTKDQFALDSVNRGHNQSVSIRNGFVQAVVELFYSKNKL